jgi:hypothetical protein
VVGGGADIRLLTNVAKQLVNLAKAPRSGIRVIMPGQHMLGTKRE